MTAICVFLSTIVHAFSLSNVGTCRYPNLSRSRLIPKHESEESIDIDVLPKRRSGPHPAFIVLVVVGSILSIAAAALERSSVRRALVGWDVDAGDEIGLVASMGVLAHCTFPLLYSPPFLVLDFLFLSTPKRHTIERGLTFSNPLNPILPPSIPFLLVHSPLYPTSSQ